MFLFKTIKFARKSLIVLSLIVLSFNLLAGYKTLKLENSGVKQLFSGEYICSPNGTYKLIVTTDGMVNFLVVGQSEPLWSIKDPNPTQNRDDIKYSFTVQDDGNIVFRNDTSDQFLWGTMGGGLGGIPNDKYKRVELTDNGRIRFTSVNDANVYIGNIQNVPQKSFEDCKAAEKGWLW